MARITSLNPFRKRIVIEVDGRRYACVPTAWVGELGFTLDEEIDLAELDSRLGQREFPDACGYALKLLGKSACSTSELARKLRGHGYSINTCKLVLQRIGEMRLLDDTDYARRVVESGNTRGKGRQAMLWKLREKGFSNDDITAAFEGWDAAAEYASAAAEASRLYARYTERGKPNARQLTYQALARHGFSSDAAARALDSLTHEHCGDVP